MFMKLIQLKKSFDAFFTEEWIVVWLLDDL